MAPLGVGLEGFQGPRELNTIGDRIIIQLHNVLVDIIQGRGQLLSKVLGTSRISCCVLRGALVFVLLGKRRFKVNGH
jgi:hypothetical protein